MKKSKNYLFLILFLVLGVTFTYAWEKAPNTIWTTWGENINPNTTLQEYPRPQMERGNWVNLNGVWRCREGSAGEAVPVGSNLSQDILVPFPIQSALSGVKQNWHRFWYRRTFTVPSGWSGQRVLLHFGAVDWESEVYINGASVGIHKGGYDPFEYDITDRLNGGTNELIVRIYDPTDADGEPGPTGKQQDARWNSTNGIWYTPSSGIWQTVWMEAVPATSIRSLKLIPNIDNSTLAVTVTTSGSTSGITVEAIAYDGSAVAGSVTGNANTQLTLPISNQKLWSPSSPFLYSLTVSLRSGSTNVDSVNSYFGMRKISRGSVGGVTKMLLNNSFLFEMGPLDQGFWPDGIYTAPSDAAIIFDIQGMKDLGYNMVRKHIKVEPERWYYHCDRLGLLVWQDMPNGSNNTTEKQNQFRTELERMINTHINHPSIIMWVTFNEQWGIFDSVNIANYAKSLDSSRLVDENSACGSGGSTVGDVRDYHYYSPPGCPAPDSRALACGEYGGLVLVKTGNMWDPNYYSTWALMTNSDSEFTTTYVNYCNQIVSLRDNSGLSAAVYTQWTDVEGELNGNYTYDRKVFKGDRASIRAALQATYSGAGTPVNPPAGTVAWESYNYRSYFIRHQDSRGRISNVISPIEDAYWRMIPGLAGAGVSFESVNYPGMYLRHTNSEIWLYASDGTALFNQDATFYRRAGLADSSMVSFESYNFPGSYIRHADYLLRIDPISDALGNSDATFREVSGGSAATSTPTPIRTSTPTPTWTPTPSRTPANTATPTPTSITTTGYPIPGLIEAENYSAMSGIQTESCSEGGLNVGWIEAGDWMDYQVNVAATGSYLVEYRVAALSANVSLQLQEGATVLGTITAPSTGGWQTWTTVSHTVSLGAGNRTLRVYASGTGWNINWLNFTSGSVATATPTRTPAPTNTPAGTATPTPTQVSNLTDITNLGGTVSAQYTDSPSGEDIAKLIDNSSSTKYLTFHASGWVQFQANASYVVTSYSITSANDAAERDPYTWTLQGSTNGSSWVTLDSRSGEDFPNRFQLRTFSFTNSASYNYYRLNMTNNSGTILQLAEWEIFGTSGTANTATPTATQAATSTPTQAATSTPTPTTSAAGFTDNFNDNAIGSAWTMYSGTWSESGGILRQDSTSQGDPCKAIAGSSGISLGSNQTITAKVYINSWTDGDSARAGVSLFTGTGDGRGYNLLFHNNHSTVQFLDDMVAWGTSYTFNWSNQTWYWFKLMTENGTLYGKIWQDGTAEPANWLYTWTRSGRTGYPALNGGTSGHGGSCTVFFDDVQITSP